MILRKKQENTYFKLLFFGLFREILIKKPCYYFGVLKNIFKNILIINL